MRKNKTSGLRLLWSESKNVRGVATIAFALLMLGTLMTLAGPWLIEQFINRATGNDPGAVLLQIALAYLGVTLLGGATRIAASYFAVQSGWRIADRLRTRLLHHASARRSVLEIERLQTGDVLEQVEGNANIVGTTIAESGFRLLSNIALVLGTMIVMTVVIPPAGIAITLLLIVVSFVLSKMARRAVLRWETARQQQGQVFGYIDDSVSARDDILLMNATPWVTRRTKDNLDALLRTEGKAYIAGRAFWPLTQLCFALALGLGFGLGLSQLSSGAISIGSLTVLYLYVDMLQGPLEEMSSQFGQVQQMMAVLKTSRRRLAEPDTTLAAVATQGQKQLPAGALGISFDQVDFSYGEKRVLHELSFRLEPGQSLALVGPTGAGKSTVVNLLCGLAKPTSGKVLIGGVEASSINAEEFAERIAVLSQRAHVFTATVRQNVTMFDDSVPADRVWAALEEIKADAWIRALPDGLDTIIGTDGRILSDGELQLIAAARVLIRPYSLLIVDEAVARFDPETERRWTTILDRLMRDRTVIMIEHRAGPLQGVGHVLTLENGRVKPPTNDFTPASSTSGGIS